MENRIIANSEVKGVLLKLTIITVLVLVSISIFSKLLWNNLNSSLINKNLSVIGNLIVRHPELKEEIITSYTGNSTAAELNAGIEEASKYGYSKNLPLGISPITGVFYHKFLIEMIVFSLIFLGLIFIMFYLSLKNIYGRINIIALGAERIVEGDFSVKIEEDKEGAFAKLAHQFNQMSKSLEAGLIQLKEEKIFLKNIISDISHQLKTPLSSLKMFNEFLQEGDLKEDIKSEFLHKSEEQLERMEWLIKNLLKMARLEAGAIEFNKERQPMLKGVMEAIEGLKLKLNEKNHSIEIICKKSDITFSYDKEWISEAISNIIKNSIEHTDENGKIQVELSESPVMVRLVIRDNGEGIHKEDIPHIFERFYKGKNNIHGSGTGIGLALSKAIIEGHDGIIKVKSRLGCGTAFEITFIKGIV